MADKKILQQFRRATRIGDLRVGDLRVVDLRVVHLQVLDGGPHVDQSSGARKVDQAEGSEDLEFLSAKPLPYTAAAPARSAIGIRSTDEMRASLIAPPLAGLQLLKRWIRPRRALPASLTPPVRCRGSA
jgi:hypothetical protein